MPEDDETPRTPGWLGDGILQNGVDQGATRRSAIRGTRTPAGSKPRPIGQPRRARTGQSGHSGAPSPGSQPRLSGAAVRPRRPVCITGGLARLLEALS